MKLQRITRRKDITTEMVTRVRACACAGCTFEQTAHIMGVEEVSLRRWMAAEFNEAKANAVAMVGAFIYNKAKGDEQKGIKGNLDAAKFYAETQGGWKKTTGIVFEDSKGTDAGQSITDILEARFARLEKAMAKAKDNGPQPVPG